MTAGHRYSESSHRIRTLVRRLRPAVGPLLRIAPRVLVSAYHRWAVRLEFDPSRYPREELPPGLNVIGYLHSATGVGESARSLAVAAREQGIPVALTNALRGPSAKYEDDSITLDQANPFDVNLFCINAYEMEILRELLGGAFFANRINIGYWYWEFDELPPETYVSFAGLQEIWVATNFVRRSVERAVPRGTSIKVRVMPPAIRSRTSRLTRRDLGLPESRFLFLAFADAASFLQRKNPLAVIEAFNRAFAGRREAVLILKINHPDADTRGMAELKKAASGHPIVFLDGTSSRDEIDGLFCACDAFVSLHRSEGFGLPCAEAMALGKPVIATDYSGSTDFVNEETAFPVPYRLVPLDSDLGPYKKGALWAEPEIGAAADRMRRVVDDPTESQRRGNAAAAEIRQRYDCRVVGQAVAGRLEELRQGK